MSAVAQDLYRRHPISVGDYNRMAESGILGIEDRVELIDGEIIDMAPIGCRHAATVNLLNKQLLDALGNTAILSVQNPIILGDLSEPEPDFAVLRPDPNGYRDHLPEAGDILLLIEVSDTTLRYDRNIKAPLYARFAIPELWLIDVEGHSITRFLRPIDGKYSLEECLASPPTLSPQALPGVTIALQSLFG
jgi:Uma2 family endonuclease